MMEDWLCVVTDVMKENVVLSAMTTARKSSTTSPDVSDEDTSYHHKGPLNNFT